MKITKEMIKRNTKIKKELEDYVREKGAVREDGSADIGHILYFLGFKIIQNEMKIEELRKDNVDQLNHLEERIHKLESKNYQGRKNHEKMSIDK